MSDTWIGKHWLSGKTVGVTAENGTIVSVRELDQASEHWIAPGLIDVQLNGIGGYDLNTPDITVDTVKQIVKVLNKGGVTRFCPTVVTGTKERMLHCIRTIAEACQADAAVDHAVIGIHVEGPFISPDDGPRGAHNLNWVRDPDWNEFEEWNKASGGRICKVTLAPEKNGAIPFIEKLCELGVVASIGHCNASEEQIQEAVRAGATMSTHLGNGAHPYIKRHPNYIWAQLADDRLWAGLIADGFHLPASTLKVMIRAKGKKAILTSDAVNLAGMPPGRYKTHINDDVILEENGFLHLASTRDILAGSATPLHIGVQNMEKFGICSLGEAINMASLHPAELFGLADMGIGNLAEGSPADLIIYEHKEPGSWTISKTVAEGETVYEQ
ncbi:N-acetylglucosamine-6-phosphate deacetylase [Paenibacillus filicis]|uniref:N-acetylglucosamine-6-phosphate deacetylase n=1 Tax=Paenibacillus gyeongsangnamensis TaxID=3388067 RepID=A0ABT4Q5L5_9BACL|nr:N-acetylglucosamine-6-phosphate deacetylase [Paenibacillus filicis]MCZ8512165.1 N-acetylglucosamine-6-phosphate deacetylase [Paenibacillus filicis]